MATAASGVETLTWDFDRSEFSLPDSAGLGRMQQTRLPSGFILYRSEFQVEKTCAIDTTTTDEQVPLLLCAQMLLSGKVVLETADGKSHLNTPQRALLFRLAEPGTRIHLAGGQLVRHVGVATPYKTVLRKSGSGELPGELAYFAVPDGSAALVRGVKVRNRLRKLLSELFTGAYEGPMAALGREGLAMTIYAEVLNEFCKTDAPSAQPAALWEQAVFQDLVAHLRANLDKPLSSEQLLPARFGLTRHRIEKLFRSEMQCSLGEFLRRERMQAARHLIETQGLPLKTAASQVGYNHVSNFTRAYRQYFGETPRQTLNLSNTNRKP